MAGISVSSWPVTEKGLQYDRKWMLVDNAGQFLSQRKLPQMALIKTALFDNHIVLSAAGRDDLLIPLNHNDGQVITTTIWHDQCLSRRVSEQADYWLGSFLNISCRLVYLPDEIKRPVNPDYAKPDDNVAFSDGFPFLIVSENSLVSLNKEMQLNLPMSRFRPNLVISGCPAYAEDSWREISIGSIDFRLPKPCSRCIVPNIDPDTAQTGKEPLLTLGRIRKWQNNVYFGQNALHNQCGILSVGDRVMINLSGDKQPPL